jgi:alpha-mannosidase
VLCDLLERDLQPLPLGNGSFNVQMQPFEVVTVKLR